jgi:hypothetical protein
VASNLLSPNKRVIDVNLSDCLKNPKQWDFINCDAKRIIVRAGRRGGKTHGVAERSVLRFLKGRRQLYAAPTQEQVDSFWYLVVQALMPLIEAKILYKNESLHVIEYPNTKQRIRAKTAWNADTLRGDYADDLILDEWQLMNEDAWELVGAPMLLDNDGDAVFIYTPPSLHAKGKKFVSKANDPQHASKMYKKAEAEIIAKGAQSRWATFHWKSIDNGYISAKAIDELAEDMSSLAYRQEIEAEDIDEAPGALWTRDSIEKGRVSAKLRYDRDLLPLERVVVSIDPSGSTTGDEAGIAVTGKQGKDFYFLEDYSLQGRPEVWAQKAIDAFYEFLADKIVAEGNFGGLMVEAVIKLLDPNIPVKIVTASRGKDVRAEPISAIYDKRNGYRGHHVGTFPKLEEEMCLWQPGLKSPNRMDALVWGGTELMLGPGYGLFNMWRRDANKQEAEKTTTPITTETEVLGDTASPGRRRTIWEKRVVENELMKSAGGRRPIILKAPDSKLCPKCTAVLTMYANFEECGGCGYNSKRSI